MAAVCDPPTQPVTAADANRRASPSEVPYSSEVVIWRLLLHVAADVAAAVERDLDGALLSLSDVRLLSTLEQEPDASMRMSDLAELLGLTPSGVTRRLDGMVDAGLVRRVVSRSDRRVMMAQLTTTGRSELTRSLAAHAANAKAHLFDRLEPDDLALLGKLVADLRGAAAPRSA